MRKRFLYWLGLLIVALVSSVYFVTQSYSIYGGDGGDLVSAIITRGIPHPPGYPLYTSLGILLEKYIPFGSPAWRISFLSSIPTVCTILLLYTMLSLVTGMVIFPAATALVYGFLYPVWLFGNVPEVFALGNLFILLLFSISWLWYKTRKPKWLYAVSFVFGLSLTHHHIVLFLLPSLLYFVFQHKDRLTKKSVCVSLCLFLLGLIPYSYVYFSTRAHPAFNWLGTLTLQNIMALILRTGYGTFTIGNYTANAPPLRLLSFLGLFDLMLKDFRILGVLFILLGLLHLIRIRKLLIALSLSIGSYLFFLFYASFPLTDSFMMGTFERFLLPLYLFFSFLVCFGMIEFSRFLGTHVLFSFSQEKKKSVLTLFSVLMLLFPTGLFLLNYPKLSLLTRDLTAEHLGEDILASLPTNSILFLAGDTPLFDTQYVYYSQRNRTDVKLIHISKLQSTDYFADLLRSYPELVLPDEIHGLQETFDFLLSHNASYPVFSKLAFATSEGVWVPWGLLFRYYKNDEVPSNEYILKENSRLWIAYHDPISSGYTVFQNLLVSDVLRIYGLAHQEFGFWTVKRNYASQAREHLLTAKQLYPQSQDTDVFLAQAYFMEKKCDEAKAVIDSLSQKDPDFLQNKYFLESINQLLCENDEKKADYFQKLYQEENRKKETQLEKL